MTPELKLKITEKLRVYLNREPSEQEVMNGQTDAVITGWVRDDEVKKLKMK